MALQRLVVLILVPLFCLTLGTRGDAPEQVHLSLTKRPAEMAVTWVTVKKESNSVVSYWPEGQPTESVSIKATVNSFKNKDGTERHVHRATMRGLFPGQRYAYHVGSGSSMSRDFVFRVPSASPPYKVVVFGCLGFEEAVSLPSLIARTKQPGNVDLIIHMGDFAYNLYKDGVGDAFMRMIEPLTATVPYMVVPGNHEEEKGNNFTTYRNLFTMPDMDQGDNHFYSFDFGPIHFIGVSSEHYGFTETYGYEPARMQYKWLQNDIKNNAPSRSKQRPWLVTLQHRPLYCSNRGSLNCEADEILVVRDGVGDVPGLAALYKAASVDIAFAAHKHQYERFLPRGSEAPSNTDPYHNADGTTYIVTGAAGNKEGLGKFSEIPAKFSIVREKKYSYTLLTIHNTTHITLEQIETEKADKVIDSIVFSKTSAKIASYRIPENAPEFADDLQIVDLPKRMPRNPTSGEFEDEQEL